MKSKHDISTLQVAARLAAKAHAAKGDYLEAAVMVRAAEIITERGALDTEPNIAKGDTYSEVFAVNILQGAIRSAIEDVAASTDDLSSALLTEEAYDLGT